MLLAHGADVDAKLIPLNQERTPLYYAVSAGYKDVEEVLLASGADAEKERLARRAAKEWQVSRVKSERADAMKTMATGVAWFVGGPLFCLAVAYAVRSAPKSISSLLLVQISGWEPFLLGLASLMCLSLYGGAKLFLKGFRDLP